ncbi:MAG: HAD-IA family hydrolase [Verrucomicrobiales bacterium]|nr:HAD-IA family hydrolase [Verrucomicrobiae bacterium]MCP5554909.1 HAD-IA family hydrolase [Akkermansiaceae bacterium]HRX55884.1 HAD-IA family hydrolase [Verrucomicrobiales bacterium]
MVNSPALPPQNAANNALPPLLVFDFDGTLADTIETGLTIYNEIAGDFGLRTVSREEVQTLRNLNTRALLHHLGISRILAVRVVTRIRRQLTKRIDSVQPFPGTIDAIRTLSTDGFRIGILSSNAAENVKQFLKRHSLLDCFRFVEAGASLFGKASRLKSLLKAQAESPETCLYIGDETRDIEAARLAGMPSIAVCWGANGREAMLTEDPAYCVETYDELVEAARNFAARNSGY